MREEIMSILETIGWGLIGFAILIIILRLLGIISSPEVIETLLAGLIFEFIAMKSDIKEIRFKLELIWKDFKKRKKIIN